MASRVAPDSRFFLIALVAGLALVVGATTAASVQLGFVVGLLLIGACFISIAPVYWALGAIIAAVVLPGIAAVGAAPGFVSYVHFPIVLTGFCLAVVKYSHRRKLADQLLMVTGALAVSCVLATLFTGAEPTRGAFAFLLLAEPVLLIAIFAMAPPTHSEWQTIKKVLLGVILLQIPFAYAQVASIGIGSLFNTRLADGVKGTIGIVGGSDVLAALGVIGGIWLLAEGRDFRRVLCATLLLLLPFFAASNKVLFAIPAIAVLSPGGTFLKVPVRIAVAAASIALVIAFGSVLPSYLGPSVEGSLSSESGKGEAATVAWHAVDGSPATLAFGAGPAETVSGAAYLTTDPLRHPNSPIRYLRMKPSLTAINLGALDASASSFTRPRSSLLGVLGDLGLLGLATYIAFQVIVFGRLYRGPTSPETIASAAGMLLVLLFAVITTGWELPQLTLFVSGLVGIALIDPRFPGSERRPAGSVS
jgi:hypothetical protein